MKKKLLSLFALVFAVATAMPPAPVQAAPAPTTSTGFTQMFENKNDMVWSGGDQSTSFKAPNGKIYWLHGDTMLSNGEDQDGSYPDVGTVMVSNRILMQTGDQLTNAMVNGDIGVPNPATHTEENQERYWTQAAFHANSHLYVLCQRVMKDPDPNTLGFKVIGTEMAKFSYAADGRLTLVSMIATPSTSVVGGAGPMHIQWAGDAIVKNGYVYAYGYTAASGNPFVAHFSYVARVSTTQVENPFAWKFYKKTTGQWVNSVALLSQDLVNQPDSLVPSQVGSVRVIGGQVVMLHKPWNGWGSAVYAEVGTNPQGPFTQKYLFESPAGTWEGKNYTTYMPMLHPEQPLNGAESGKILVSINWNGVDFWTDVLGNADLYKPRFHAVTLP